MGISMDSSKLKVLIRAVETATFSAAGEELGFTQAGVSYIIKTLEDELGIQLLIRGKMGVRLTQKGEALMEHVRNADAAMDALLSRAEALKNAQTGRLKIGALNSLSVAWLPSVIASFCADNPDIQIDVQEAGTDKLTEMLSTGETDFILTSVQPKGVDWIPLAKDRLMAVMHKEHRFAPEARIPLQILAKEPFIMPAPGFDTDIERLFQRSGIKANVILPSMDDYAIVSMVQHGIGVSVVPEMILRDKSEGLAVRELAPCQYRRLGIAIPSLSDASPAAAAFIRRAQEIVPNIK